MVELTPKRIRAARYVAAGVDLLQIALLPTFFPAAISGANNVIDVIAAVVLIALAGWHWAFLPTFMIEMVPMADLAPTWSAAVYIATRGLDEDTATETEAEIQPPTPLRPGNQASGRSSGS